MRTNTISELILSPAKAPAEMLGFFALDWGIRATSMAYEASVDDTSIGIGDCAFLGAHGRWFLPHLLRKNPHITERGSPQAGFAGNFA